MNDITYKDSKRFFGLDFLRVLAVSMMLFSHSSWIYNSHGFLGKLQDVSGFLGVELFIVLSGFLIGGMLCKQFLQDDYTLKDASLFIGRRLLRLLPSYYLVILINMIVFLIFGFSLSGLWKYFLLLQNFATSIPIFFPETWSLTVKEMGYVFIVVLLLILSGLVVKFSKRLLFLTVVLGLIIFTLFLKIYYSMYSSNLDLRLWSFNVRSVVIYRIDSVLIGVLLGYFYINYKDFVLLKRKVFLLFGVLLFLVLFLCIAIFNFRLNNEAWFWNVLCLPTISLAICMFIPFLLNWERPSENLGGIISFICKVSYSVYLLHYSFVLFLLKYFIDTSSFNLLQLNLFTFFYLIVTFSLSYLLYAFFEKPINEYRLRKMKLRGK